MSTAASLMTFAQFEQLADLDGFKRESVGGEVVTLPPPKEIHSDTALAFSAFSPGISPGSGCVRTTMAIVSASTTGFAPGVSVTWSDQLSKVDISSARR